MGFKELKAVWNWRRDKECRERLWLSFRGTNHNEGFKLFLYARASKFCWLLVRSSRATVLPTAWCRPLPPRAKQLVTTNIPRFEMFPSFTTRCKSRVQQGFAKLKQFHESTSVDGLCRFLHFIAFVFNMLACLGDASLLQLIVEWRVMEEVRTVMM